jgi:uncharacterized membrane protein YesL
LPGVPAHRVVWKAVVSLWDESITFIGANLLWCACNLPFGLLLVVLLVPLLVSPTLDEGTATTAPPFLVAGWLLLFLPTPASAGLGAVAAVGAGLDAPRTRSLFWPAVRRHWRRATALFVVSFLGTVLLLANLIFYWRVTTGWLQVASVLWLYALLFWLGMQLYLVPLLLHLEEPRLLDVYRRAALITLGHPFASLFLVIVVALAAVAGVLLIPVYLLVAGSFAALVQAHAFREIRRRHGELPDEEIEPA